MSRPRHRSAPDHRLPREIQHYVAPGKDVPLRIRKYGLTYIWKSARLITGTQSVNATYRLEGQSNHAKSK